MFREEENQLKQSKNEHNAIEIPDNIHHYIRNGITEGKKYKRNKFRKRIMNYAAAILIIGLLTTVRISPAFADFMSQIPGIDYIVNLINYDKGLKLAVENDFIQHIGVSDEHEDLVLTVEDIIVDESRMILFYSVENKGEEREVILRGIDLLDETGKNLEASIFWDRATDDYSEDKEKLKGKIEVSFAKDIVIPDNIQFVAKMDEVNDPKDSPPIRDTNTNFENYYTGLASTWKIDIPVDKEKFENLTKTYPINKEVVVGGQKIFFDQMILYPTRVAVDVTFDEENSMKIFSFDQLRIVDEKDSWYTTSNGVTSTWADENTRRFFLESNYFTHPDKIYLEADGIQALAKNQLEVMVDLEKKVLLSAPDNRLILEDIKKSPMVDELEVIFGFKTNEPHTLYSLFENAFTDASGQEFTSKGVSTAGTIDELYNNKIYFSIDSTVTHENPISLKLWGYPNTVEDPFKIKIK